MNAIRLSPTVRILLIAQFAAFVLQQIADRFLGANLMSIFGLVPSSFVMKFYFWQIFTYSFLHADVMHLFLNLLLLAFVGSDMEYQWGRKKFLIYYFFCVGIAGLVYVALQMLMWSSTSMAMPMVGSSAALYGLLLAYGLVFGERVMLFMMLFPMKARYFVWVLAGVELMMTVFTQGAFFTGMAHLSGMGAGLFFLWAGAWYQLKKMQRDGRTSQWFGRARPKRDASHLKLVKGSGESSSKGPRDWQ